MEGRRWCRVGTRLENSRSTACDAAVPAVELEPVGDGTALALPRRPRSPCPTPGVKKMKVGNRSMSSWTIALLSWTRPTSLASICRWGGTFGVPNPGRPSCVLGVDRRTGSPRRRGTRADAPPTAVMTISSGRSGFAMRPAVTATRSWSKNRPSTLATRSCSRAPRRRGAGRRREQRGGGEHDRRLDVLDAGQRRDLPRGGRRSSRLPLPLLKPPKTETSKLDGLVLAR